jgi:hypothetical protein
MCRVGIRFASFHREPFIREPRYEKDSSRAVALEAAEIARRAWLATLPPDEFQTERKALK